MSGYYQGVNAMNGGTTCAVRRLLVVTCAAYLLQIVLDRVLPAVTIGPFAIPRFSYFLGLSRTGLGEGYVWQLFSYMFLHGSLWHLLFNMLALFFMGPETERTIGTRAFYVLYLMSGVLGGMGWLLLSYGGLCLGASGAIFGILASFATLYPNRLITFLLFFVLPMTLKAWVLVTGLVVLELLLLITESGGNVAHSAHLAGALAGYIYTATVFRNAALAWPFRRRGARLRVVRPKQPPAPDLSEIDRILSKIAREGMGSLSREERNTLEKASRDLGR